MVAVDPQSGSNGTPRLNRSHLRKEENSFRSQCRAKDQPIEGLGAGGNRKVISISDEL